MPQRYKLRLGDGTVLVVDHDGLSTWTVDRKAMVQPESSKQWFSLAEFLVMDRIEARRAMRQEASRSAAEPPSPTTGAPLTTASPALEEPAELEVLDWDPMPPAAEAAPPVAHVVVDRSSAAARAGSLGSTAARTPRTATSSARGPDDSCPPIPLVPLGDATAAQPGTRLSLQVLADDPVRMSGSSTASTGLPGQDLSTIPLKPLDDPAEKQPDEGERALEDERELESQGRGELDLEVFFRSPAGMALLRGTGALAMVMSRGLEGMVALSRRLRARARAAASLARPARPRGNAPVGPSNRHAAAEPKAPPRIEAPPSLEKLPLLRFAETPEPEADPGHVYDGDGGRPGLLAATWRWTTRVLLFLVLAGGGLYAAVNFRAWFPRAGELGNQAMIEIDRHARRLAGDEERSIDEASAQLPHLAPHTVGLLLRESGASARNPGDLFRRACDAADRGRQALTASEMRELAALQKELLGALSPRERQLVREYDRARASDATFPSDDGAALELVAGAARGLRAERLDRLQALLGKATAAGLSRTPLDSPASPAAAR